MSDENKKRIEPATPHDPDPRALLDAVVSRAVHAAGSEAGLVTLWEDEGLPFHTSSYGLDEEEARTIAANLCRRPQLPAPKQKQADKQEATAMQVSASDEPFSVVAHLRGEPVKMVAIPLRSGGKVVGLLCLLDQPTTARLENASLNVVVEQVDIVVQNAHLFRRLLNEKRWLEEVIQQAGEAILIVDRQRRIIGLNRALEQLSGWRGTEVWGRDAQRVFDFRAPDDDGGRYFALPAPDGHQHKESETDWLTAHLEDADIYETPNQRVPADELTIRTWDNRRVPVEASCGVIRAEGRVLGATITLHDISSRKEAEQLQATFLSVISHELQTPIAIIKGYAGLLGDTISADNLQAQQQLGIVYEESERLSKMVDNLLTASRIQASGLELNREPLDVGGLLRRVAEKMGALLVGDGKWRIRVDASADLPAAYADYARVEQVLTNLIENALKYAPEGDVTLSARQRDGELLLCVCDEGMGVPSAERERIFTPFTRLDSRKVREMKGVGLGLYIARSIVNAHGGQIWVEDSDEGEGACFCFTLPADMGD